MIGAIAGDIIGSVYEANNIKTTDFPLFAAGCRFTDDTVLTVALADTILNGGSFAGNLETYYYRYPHAGYGGFFRRWVKSHDRRPYNSWGNGSAMRVSPIGFAYPDLQIVLQKAKESGEVTHNHPEGIKGAQATAASIFLARSGESKEAIRRYVETTFGYDLGRELDDIREHYEFDESCQGTVPEAITAFLESTDYEDAVRKAISIGGDSDTIACITGGIAEAYYKGVPKAIADTALSILDDKLRAIVVAFRSEYCREMSC
jgi:ADP-ribosylglycohydrolase